MQETSRVDVARERMEQLERERAWAPLPICPRPRLSACTARRRRFPRRAGMNPCCPLARRDIDLRMDASTSTVPWVQQHAPLCPAPPYNLPSCNKSLTELLGQAAAGAPRRPREQGAAEEIRDPVAEQRAR